MLLKQKYRTSSWIGLSYWMKKHFQQKAAAKVLRKMKAPNGSFLYKKCFTACHGADIAPLVYTFLWIGNKPICEDIIIVLNLLKLKVLKIIVILLGISRSWHCRLHWMMIMGNILRTSKLGCWLWFLGIIESWCQDRCKKWRWEYSFAFGSRKWKSKVILYTAVFTRVIP